MIRTPAREVAAARRDLTLIVVVIVGLARLLDGPLTWLVVSALSVPSAMATSRAPSPAASVRPAADPAGSPIQGPATSGGSTTSPLPSARRPAAWSRATERASTAGRLAMSADERLFACCPGYSRVMSDQSNTQKAPDDWTTGEEPMTGAQGSYLNTLAGEAGEKPPTDLSKAEASKKIDELQRKTGRGS